MYSGPTLKVAHDNCIIIIMHQAFVAYYMAFFLVLWILTDLKFMGSQGIDIIMITIQMKKQRHRLVT